MKVTPEDILRFGLGHADKSITDRYSKMKDNIENRKNWSHLAGLGFDVKGAGIETQIQQEVGA
jgi:hypothetical protein